MPTACRKLSRLNRICQKPWRVLDIPHNHTCCSIPPPSLTSIYRHHPCRPLSSDAAPACPQVPHLASDPKDHELQLFWLTTTTTAMVLTTQTDNLLTKKISVPPNNRMYLLPNQSQMILCKFQLLLPIDPVRIRPARRSQLPNSSISFTPP